MRKKSKRIYALLLIFVLSCTALALLIKTGPNQQTYSPKIVGEVSAANLNDQIGINGALPSLTTNTAKMNTAANRMSEAHFGWSRHEFHYASNMSYGFYDNAVNIQSRAGIKTLGLLAYPGTKDINVWKNYVRSVVGHYGTRITAWEVMNEADVYLSASEYANFLREAHTIIKGINPNAAVISTGLSSRQEAATFLDELAANGVWDKFDDVGLHIYHNGSPEQVNWGGGSIANEVSRIVGTINRNGGGKHIWITEMGYKSSDVGSDTNQGRALARAIIMAKSFPAVEKIFIYRLYDNSSEPWGILNSALSPKASFSILKDTIGQINGRGSGEKIFTNYNVLDDNDPVPSGWYAGETTNASLVLGGGWGYSGMSLMMDYTMDMGADKAYTMSQKTMGEGGPNTAFGAWVKGDDSKNFWKIRIEDTEGETFQIDFGALSSDWQHVQFVVGRDPAIVSWGGNGQIDYPFHFSNVVIDRMGGQDKGTAWFDKIGFLPDVDTYAYKMGDLVAYWKQQGSGHFNICGRDVEFTETPQFFTGC